MRRMHQHGGWPSRLLLLLGTWLFCSPIWIGSYDLAGAAAVWNSHAVGAMLVVTGALALIRPKLWQPWLAFALACWLIVAPFVLAMHSITGAATGNHLLVGLLVGLDALGLLITREWRAT